MFWRDHHQQNCEKRSLTFQTDTWQIINILTSEVLHVKYKYIVTPEAVL